VLKHGCLPSVRAARSAAARTELLEAYVENYLAQEIRVEAAVKNLDAFARFLSVAALCNAQVTNVSAIARDAGVARPTVQGYFDTLVDTLLGVWLPAWRPRAKIKEVAHPKFYLFDTGVARALAGRVREPLEREERGHLLETYVLHELRAYIEHAGIGGELFYWRTPSGTEVDFVWQRARHRVAIEVKATDRWRNKDGAGLRELALTAGVERTFGVYLGESALKDGDVEILPLSLFLQRLAQRRIVG
jgi:predicted AAA+ superfamily ATPase